MSTFQLSVQDRLATITLDRGRSNPINHQMVKELTACIKNLEEDDNIGGLIITGKGGFFSSGVDLIEAYDYNEGQVREFWIDFLVMQNTMASFSKPMVAAISGHSPAGGCVMAICCDYRVMAEGKFIIGLNEVQVGIVVPTSVFDLYAFWVGQRRAYQHLIEGKLLNVNEALEVGLVDEVCSPEEVLSRAEKKAKAYMQFNPDTWSQGKLNLRMELLTKLNGDQTATLDKMLKQWWATETRKGLQRIVQNLKSKSTLAN